MSEYIERIKAPAPRGDLSKHFSRHEFACRCGCGLDTVDVELITVLEALREQFGKPITVNCGIRCTEHNAKVGGGKKSQHLLGKAADIVVAGFDTVVVADYLEDTYPGRYGIGCYETFTHIDVRAEKARWVG